MSGEDTNQKKNSYLLATESPTERGEWRERMDGPRILLVDDDTSLLQALPHMLALRLHGVLIETADSAQKALELILEPDREYDTIVSDIKMPGMDGLELLAQIQALRPEIPTLLITGHGDQELITQALRGGAYDFIQKPIDRVYLVAALHRAMQTRQLRRQVQEQQRALEQYAHSLEHLVERRTRELLAANEAVEVLVRDVLDISLIEADKLILHPTRCNLVELCQHVLNAYTVGAGLGLTFDFAEESVEVEVDYDRISQVLLNLLFHARRSSLKGSPLTILLQRTSNEAIITVQEMSEEMAEELVPHPFEQFSLGPEIQGRSPAGEGLSLALSQQIVERHGGHIKVQRRPEGGSTFSLVFPLAASTATELREHEPSLFQPPQWLLS